jgi:DNA polymerase elongation subunit (family B)
MSYRNIVYSPFDKEIVLYTWDNNAQRIEQRIPFKPFLYIEDKNGQDGISIYNTRLRKIEFEESFKRKEFVTATPRTFYNLQAEQQFLIQKYLGLNKDEKFSRFPLKIFFLDIETHSPNGFPDPQKAEDPISLISVWDSITEGIYTFGLRKEYFTKDDSVIYRCFETEEELIKAFIRFWRKDFPDIVSGWYSDGFDIPYLCHRINKIYKDPKAVNRLSPVGQVFRKENVHKRLEDYKELWTISGVTSIDYQYAYKVFTKEKRASYSLNAIGEEELGVGKLQYNAVSLSELASNDWNRFVDYNIQDVRLLVQFEDKLKYLETCREIAYRGLSPIINALSTVGVVTGLAAQKALERNRIISTFTPQKEENYEGGFVKESQRGLQKSLLYFDANSLYPNTIVTLNVSPETKLAKIIERNAEKKTIRIKTVYGQEYELSNDDFQKFIEKEEIAISKSNILFAQKTRGIFSDIIEEIYAERVQIKKELKDIKNLISKFSENDVKYKELKQKSQLLDIQQYTKKIFLNRCYGYFAEKHSPLYDIDLASSVTSTGQACIKQAAETTNNFIKEKYGLDYDSIILSDTDSICLTIEPILQKENQTFLINNEINPIVYQIADEINTEIDSKINKWANSELNSKYSKYEFKRENISSVGAFMMKKRYILNIRDEEGKKVDKFKYTGVEVVQTKTPKKVKALIKNAIETAIKRGDKKEVETILKNTYEEYQKFSIEDLAMPISLNGYEKYKNRSNGFKTAKSTPIHVKAAIYHNLLLEKKGLTNKYETLKSGSKIKLMYVLPNTYNLQTIAFLGNFPEEFKLEFKPDIEVMFEKTVLKPIYRVLEAIGWNIKNPLINEKVDLLGLFS